MQSAKSLVVAVILSLACYAGAAGALTPIDRVDLSSDITQSLDSQAIADEDVAADHVQSAVITPADLGELPAASDLTAYHLFDDGDQLLSFDIVVSLAGPLIASPANEINGIFAGSGSTVAGNTASTNGQNGITAEGSTSVQNNTVTSNQALGLNLTTTTPYLGNTITDNVTGGVGDGKNQGHNFCSGTNVSFEACP